MNSDTTFVIIAQSIGGITGYLPCTCDHEPIACVIAHTRQHTSTAEKKKKEIRRRLHRHLAASLFFFSFRFVFNSSQVSHNYRTVALSSYAIAIGKVLEPS
jgi:hypothetical protein